MEKSLKYEMARLRAFTCATKKELSQLRKMAIGLGRTPIFSAAEVAEAMVFFALAGFNANKIMGAMPCTLNLAAVGQLCPVDAVKTVVKIMNGIGIDGKVIIDKLVGVLAATSLSRQKKRTLN